MCGQTLLFIVIANCAIAQHLINCAIFGQWRSPLAKGLVLGLGLGLRSESEFGLVFRLVPLVKYASCLVKRAD